jgi:hypothetical protein
MSRDGYRILKVEKNSKQIYLGSKYNQKREVDKFLCEFNEFTGKDTYIVIGMSFGEHIKELLRVTNKLTKILIVELNDELIDYCKNDADIKKIVNDERVIITNNIGGINEFFDKYVSELNVKNVKVKGFSIYDKIYAEELQDIYSLIRDRIVKYILNKNTTQLQGENFFENTLQNIKNICKSTEINKLKGKYKNKPAIIVSAGPSLIKNIDQLKGIENALILTGGRTLGALLERGINPSCLGVLDAGEVSYKLVEPHIQKINCPLVYTDMTNERAVNEHKAGKYFFTQNIFIEEVWGKKIKDLLGGGSIAHTLTLLATYMECNPIIFIGQDLAYTGERGHAICSGNRWNELTFDMYKRNDDVYVKDINGEPVRTSVLLNNYRVALEDIVKVFHTTEFINATEGGADIKGTKVETLEEVLMNLNKEKIIPMETYLVKQDKTEEMINYLERTVKYFDEYKGLCKEVKDTLKEYRKNYYLNNNNGVSKKIKQIEKIERKIVDNSGKIAIVVYLINKSIYDMENVTEFDIKTTDDEKVAFEKNYEKSYTLYSNIQKVLDDYKLKIEKTIEELKREG